ncbi:MAG: hypothetical protein AAGH70_07905 [Pseudomonadota bacterium]
MMHPADEYARLKDQIKALEARAQALRTRFIRGDAPLASEAVEVRVSRHTRRVFMKDRLPDYILREPSLWEERSSHTVTYAAATPSSSAFNSSSNEADEDLIVVDVW